MKKLSVLEKAHLIVTLVLIGTLLVAIAYSIIEQRWFALLISVLALFLMFIPTLFERRTKIDLPVEFEILTVLFIYATLFLGEVHGYYTRFWWWDALLHAGSGIALGFVGFMLLFSLYKTKKLQAKPWLIAVFGFCFALALGAMWEIYEFAMDQIFGLNMQKSGIIDTMWDLIVDAVGAALVSIIGFIYMKIGKSSIFDLSFERFRKHNPSLFR
jgi:hypothetical protein